MKPMNAVLPFECASAPPGAFDLQHARGVIPDAFAAHACALTKAQGVGTPAMLLAAWQALLWRLTRSPVLEVDAHLGSSIAPMRTHFTEHTRFVEVLAACEKQLRSLSGERPEQISGCAYPFAFEARDAGSGTFKLKLSIRGADIDLGYDGSCFEPQDMAVLVEQYVTLLQEAVRDPQLPVASLPINSSRHQALLRQHHHAVRPASEADTDLVDWFEQRVAQTPDAIALVAGPDRLSYRELNRRANQLARHLRHVGVGPEARVALCLERTSDMLVAILGVLKAGGAYVPLDPAWPKDRSRWIVQESGCSVLLTHDASTDHLEDLTLLRVDLTQLRAQTAADPVEDLPRLATPENAAYVIYTSGSTGRPKGVVITRANVVRLFRSTEKLFDLSHNDVWSMCHSYAFDYSVWEMWGAWLYGGKLVLASRVETQSPEQLYDLLEREGVTILSQTPSGFRALLQELERVPARTLRARAIVFGGEALDPGMLRALHERYPAKQLINMYGITETTVHSTYKLLTAQDIHEGGRSVVGVELDHLRIYVLGQDFREAGLWETGELFIAGSGLARCYLENPELTAQRFLPEPHGASAGERMYRTGDLARRRPDGGLEYLGRCDHQVKIRGYRIELGEIESALRHVGGVREAAVVLDTQADEARLVAYVFRESSGIVSADVLREQLLQKLPQYMVPAAFVILDRIPVTANGKLDRSALPRPGTERPEQRQAYVAPRTQLEQAIAGIWAQVLRIESVGVHDNFFDLGGHSLLLVHMQEQLRKELKRNVPIVELFARPNISALAELMACESAPSGQLLTRSSGGADRRLASRRRRQARSSVPAVAKNDEVHS